MSSVIVLPHSFQIYPKSSRMGLTGSHVMLLQITNFHWYVALLIMIQLAWRENPTQDPPRVAAAQFGLICTLCFPWLSICSAHLTPGSQESKVSVAFPHRDPQNSLSRIHALNPAVWHTSFLWLLWNILNIQKSIGSFSKRASSHSHLLEWTSANALFRLLCGLL